MLRLALSLILGIQGLPQLSARNDTELLSLRISGLTDEAILEGLGLLRQFLHSVQDKPRNDI